MRDKISHKITVYEIDGVETINAPDFVVRSHWNCRGIVVLVYDKKTITVAADALKRAVANCEWPQ